jgi:hypothetical protein
MAVQNSQFRLEPASERAAIRADALAAGIFLLAVYDLGLALFMAVAPHAFYASVGPFGARNNHYIRDTATFSAAFGCGLAISLRALSWRVPMLAISTIQFALHSVNHLVDIGAAHPAWTGYFDFFSLALSTGLLALLLRAALTQEGRVAARLRGARR